MCFGNIVQVIGHAFADIQRWIGFQPLQNAKDRQRIFFEAGKGLSPGQLRPAALTGKTPDMLIVMSGPDGHLPHHTLFIFYDKWPHGKFRGGQYGKAFQRSHG